jgi:hypothetical protein
VGLVPVQHVQERTRFFHGDGDGVSVIVQVAVASDNHFCLGVERQCDQVSRIERDEVEPRFSTIRLLEVALGVDAAELVEGHVTTTSSALTSHHRYMAWCLTL